MGSPSYMRSVIDRNVVMRAIPVSLKCSSLNPASIYRGCVDSAAETQTHACWVCPI